MAHNRRKVIERARWTPEERTRLLAMHIKGSTREEQQRAFPKRTADAIKQQIGKMVQTRAVTSSERNKCQPWTVSKEQRLWQLAIVEQISLSELTDVFGVSASSLYRKLTRMKADKDQHSEIVSVYKHWTVDEEQRLWKLAMLEKMPRKALMVEFGVSAASLRSKLYNLRMTKNQRAFTKEKLTATSPTSENRLLISSNQTAALEPQSMDAEMHSHSATPSSTSSIQSDFPRFQPSPGILKPSSSAFQHHQIPADSLEPHNTGRYILKLPMGVLTF